MYWFLMVSLPGANKILIQRSAGDHWLINEPYEMEIRRPVRTCRPPACEIEMVDSKLNFG